MTPAPTLELESTHRGSAGRASTIRWLDGKFYGPLVGVIVGGVLLGGLFMTLSGGRQEAIVPIILFCSSPTVGLMTYVLVFRRNRPPGWDRDLLATVQLGRDREPPRARLRHPLHG